jgi:hypothetical protein
MQDSKDDFDDDAPSSRRADLDGIDDSGGLGIGTPSGGLGIGTPNDFVPGSSQSVRRRQAHEVEVNVWEDDHSGVDFAVRLVSCSISFLIWLLHLISSENLPGTGWSHVRRAGGGRSGRQAIVYVFGFVREANTVAS